MTPIASNPSTGGPVPYASAPTSVWGAVQLRHALRSFETLLLIALAVSVVVVVQDALTWAGVLSVHVPAGPRPFADGWSIGLGVGLQVALGLTIAILVIIGIVVAVTGLIAWRRGVTAMVQGSPEFGPAQVAAARTAREDHSLTLWLFLVYVIVAAAVSIAFVGINATLSAASAGTWPEVVGSVATGLATSGVLVAIYYYGARHLLGMIYGISAPHGRALLVRGRDLMVWGAVAGAAVALAPLTWVFDVVAVVSLAVILSGVRDVRSAYDLWLAGHGGTITPIGGPLAAPA